MFNIVGARLREADKIKLNIGFDSDTTSENTDSSVERQTDCHALGLGSP